MMTGGQHIAGAVCLAVGVLVYFNTLDCKFCYDDKAAILENKDIVPTTPWTNLLKNDFWGTPMERNNSHKSYRPLCVATFRLNYLLHELEPMGYHLVNILLHGVVCYLYVQLCSLVFSEVWPALIAGLLFAVHPIHTEAVAGVVGRAEVLGGLFFISCVLCYHQCTRVSDRSAVWLIASLLLATCALLSKETGLTVTAVCVLYEHFILQKNTLSSTLRVLGQVYHRTHPLPQWVWPFMRRLMVMCVFTVVILCLRLWLSGSAPTFKPIDNEGLSLESPYRQLYWAYMTFVNSGLLVNPTHLLHDYRMQAIPLIESFIDYRNLITVATLAVYGFLGMYSLHAFDLLRSPQVTCSGYVNGYHTNGYHLNGFTDLPANGHCNGNNHISHTTLKSATNGHYNNGGSHYKYSRCKPSSHLDKQYTSQQVLLFGLCLIVVPFLPASNLFFPVGFVVAERVLYLPSMGLCLLVAHGAWKLLKRRSTSQITQLLLFALILTHTAKTVSRNEDWQSKITLYQSLLRLYPTNGYALANLAKEYRNIGQFDRAEAAYRLGMSVAPNVSINYVNLGHMLKKQQRLQESEEVLFSALDMIKRTFYKDPANVGKLANLYVSLSGLVGKDTARLEQALQLVEEGLALNDSMSQAHNSRGSLLLRLNQQYQAEREFQRALEIEPTNTNALYNLAVVQRHRGEVEKSVKTLQLLLEVDSTHDLARDLLSELSQSI